MAFRESLGSLTLRGRSFVAAGLVSIGCAFVVGERDLIRLGVLILALPVLSAIAVARSRYRLSCGRRLVPRRVPVGHDARVHVRLENVTWLPTGLLLVEDRLPYALGGRPRFVVERLEARGVREVSYPVRSDLRGRFPVGPLTVRIADPFGLLELDRAFTSTDQLVVTPRLIALPAARIGGDWSGGGESHTATAAAAGEDDVAPREYRYGDDLRRVHWRSTARHGELMVRREERQWRSRGTLLLDTRRTAHHGDGPGSSFENAVTIAASIGMRLAHDGFGVRFVTDEGPIGTDGAFEDTLLDALATARPSRRRTLGAGVAALRGEDGRGGERGGLVVAVLAGLTTEDIEVLSSTGPRAGVAVVLTGRDRDGSPRPVPETTALAAAGWRTLTLTSADELATVRASLDAADLGGVAR
jgi:uncharacterized protein (DUF58 family)